MSLLFDQNLSPSLARSLSELFPRSRHVRDVDLHAASDEVVWRFAADHQLTIVSKDSDFHQMSLVRGQPPKVIWIRTGNCSTDDIERIIRKYQGEIIEFLEDPNSVFLSLG